MLMLNLKKRTRDKLKDDGDEEQRDGEKYLYLKPHVDTRCALVYRLDRIVMSTRSIKTLSCDREELCKSKNVLKVADMSTD